MALPYCQVVAYMTGGAEHRPVHFWVVVTFFAGFRAWAAVIVQSIHYHALEASWDANIRVKIILAVKAPASVHNVPLKLVACTAVWQLCRLIEHAVHAPCFTWAADGSCIVQRN